MNSDGNTLTDIKNRNGDSNYKEEKKKDTSKDGCSDLQSINTNEAFWRLKEKHETKKKYVRKSMHKAMSPISAISGYLELIRMFLKEDAESEQIEKYRSKIAEGMTELEKIVEDLYDTFDSENDENEIEIKKTG